MELFDGQIILAERSGFCEVDQNISYSYFANYSLSDKINLVWDTLQAVKLSVILPCM